MSDLNKLKELRNALLIWQDAHEPTQDKEQYDMFGEAIDAIDRLEAAEAECARLDRESQNLSNQLVSCDRERVEAKTKLAERDKQKAIGKVVLGEYDDCGNHPDAKVVCLHDQADWENFQDGAELFLRPVPAIKVIDDE